MRWKEEFTIVNYEMRWTVNYFIYKAKWWKDSIAMASNPEKTLTDGQIAYGHRQSAQWNSIAVQADKAFAAANVDYVKHF